MHRYRDLTVTLIALSPEDFVERLNSSPLPIYWEHESSEHIKEVAKMVGKNSLAFAYIGPDAPHAILWLYQKTNKTFDVPNIVPTETSELSTGQYSLVLEQFIRDFLSPLEDQGLIDKATEPENYNIEDVLPSKVAEALRSFSALANKSTGSSHPNDFERWCDFLIELHHNNSRFDIYQLREFLEEDGWLHSGREIDKLTSQFEFARDLLEQYDQRRGMNHD